MPQRGEDRFNGDRLAAGWKNSALLQREPYAERAIDAADHLALPFQHRRMAAQEGAQSASADGEDHRAEETEQDEDDAEQHISCSTTKPPCGWTNCGRKARKNRAVFGLSTLITYIAVVFGFVFIPGPATLLTVARATSSGTKVGIATGAGAPMELPPAAMSPSPRLEAA